MSPPQFVGEARKEEESLLEERMRNKKTTIGRNLSREGDDNNKGHYHSPTPSGQIHHNGGRTNMRQQIAPRSPTMPNSPNQVV
jgi:hypothetical protein